MFDLAWGEMLVIVAVAVLVIGPKEIPGMMRAAGRVTRRLQYMRFALSQQFEDIMKDHDLAELRSHNERAAQNSPDTDEAAADAEEDISPPAREASP